MTITIILIYVIARQVWGWSRIVAGVVTPVFLAIDLAFLGANSLKILGGGWVPLVIAGVLFTLASTWKTGRRILMTKLQQQAYPLRTFLDNLENNPPIRVPGTAVFMAAGYWGTPPALLHNLQHNKVLHERVVVLTVSTAEVPRVPGDERVQEIERLGHGFYRVILRFGFMDDPNVPAALRALPVDAGLHIDLEDTAFFLGRETLLATPRPGMALWREKLFGAMSRNASRATAFFRLPPDRVVEIGMHVEI